MCNNIGLGSRLTVTINGKNETKFNSLSQAQEAAKSHKGNESIVRNDDGSYSLHSITNNPNQEKQIIEMAQKGETSMFNPKVVEFSLQGTFYDNAVKVENSVGEKDFLSEAGSEIRGAYLEGSKLGKNEFASEDEAIAAAKLHTGIEAVVKGDPVNGKPVYKLYRASQEDIDKLTNNPNYKGKITAFVVPTSINLPFMYTPFTFENVIKIPVNPTTPSPSSTQTTGTSSTSTSAPVTNPTSVSTTEPQGPIDTTSVSITEPQIPTDSTSSDISLSDNTFDTESLFGFDYDFGDSFLDDFINFNPVDVSSSTVEGSSSTSSTTASSGTGNGLNDDVKKQLRENYQGLREQYAMSHYEQVDTSSATQATLTSKEKIDEQIAKVDQIYKNNQQKYQKNAEAISNNLSSKFSSVDKKEMSDNKKLLDMLSKQEVSSANLDPNVSKYMKNKDGSDMSDDQLKSLVKESINSLQDGKTLSVQQSLLLSSVASDILKSNPSLDDSSKAKLQSLAQVNSSLLTDIDSSEKYNESIKQTIANLELQKIRLTEMGVDNTNPQVKALENQISAVKNQLSVLQSEPVNKENLSKAKDETIASGVVSDILKQDYDSSIKDIETIKTVLNDSSKSLKEKIDQLKSQLPNNNFIKSLDETNCTEATLNSMLGKVNQVKQEIESIGKEKFDTDNNLINNDSALKEARSNENNESINNLMGNPPVAKLSQVEGILQVKNDKSVSDTLKLLTTNNLTKSNMSPEVLKYFKNSDGTDISDAQIKALIDSSIKKLENGGNLSNNEILMLTAVADNVIKTNKNLTPQMMEKLQTIKKAGIDIKAEMDVSEKLVNNINERVKSLTDLRASLLGQGLSEDSASVKAVDRRIAAANNEASAFSAASDKTPEEKIDAREDSEVLSMMGQFSTKPEDIIRNRDTLTNLFSNPNVDETQVKQTLLRLFGRVPEGLFANGKLNESFKRKILQEANTQAADISSQGLESAKADHEKMNNTPEIKALLNKLRTVENEGEKIYKKLSPLLASRLTDCPLNNALALLAYGDNSKFQNMITSVSNKRNEQIEDGFYDNAATEKSNANAQIEMADMAEANFSANDRIDSSEDSVVNLLKKFREIIVTLDLETYKVKRSVASRNGIDRKFSETLKENRARWDQLDQAKAEYMDTFKNSSEVQKPMLPESVKKAFNNLDVAKNKNVEITSKLENLMKKYDESISQGKKPSLELSTQINRQLDLLMSSNRSIKSIIDSIPEVFNR